ncbi:hypothetical protein [Novacetimonas hansenii]|nr:hypothetical protein [Novacetimonas hansenii]
MARERALERCDQIRFRWRRQYNLPPTDPRYLEMTVGEMLEDLLCHQFLDHPETRATMITDDFDEELARLEAEAARDPASPADGGTDIPDDFIDPVV